MYICLKNLYVIVVPPTAHIKLKIINMFLQIRAIVTIEEYYKIVKK